MSANLIIQFQDDGGEEVGPQLDVPQNVSATNLETLLNGLLRQSERVPYNFYVDDRQFKGELGAHLQKNVVSIETVLKIKYQPQALFRVRPVARCTASVAGHSESILTVAFSPNGKHLSSGSGDTTVRLWDLATQTPQKSCKGHKSWVLCLAWSPDARMLASGGMEGNIWLWNPKNGTLLRGCKGHTKWVTSVAWEPAHLQLPSRRLCSGSKDASIKVWDADTGACLFTMSNHTKAISCIRWSGQGHIISAARDCAINVWSGKDGRLLQSLKGHSHWVNTLALSSEYVLRTGAFDHTGLAPEDQPAAQQVALQRYTAATSQGEKLASGSDDFTMFLWTPGQSEKPLQRMTGHMQLINQVAFSPDGRMLASASFDKSIKLWDGIKGTFLTTLRGHVGPVYQISWSSDSRLIVSASKDTTLKVWDAASQKLLVDLPGHADEVFAVDWGPNGASVASGGKDRTLRLWRQ